MWSAVFGVLVLYSAAWVRAYMDPCAQGQHTELDQKERSTGFHNEYPTPPLCDITLQPGWYRFTSLAGGTMPEHCPNRQQCGTVVPVWMNGRHPSVAEGIVMRQACGNFNTGATVTHPCCEHSVDIGVKNCGEFYVYYLKPTPSCPIAYCAGSRPPCPVGQWSPSGFPPCKEAYPKITSDPTLTGPEVAGNTFHFSCHVNYTAHDPDLAFDVLWTFDGKPDPNHVPMQTLRDPDRVAQLDGALLQGHLGTNVGCQIRARYMTHINMTSPWLKSNTYWAGIRVEQTHVTVSEKEQTSNVTLVSTLPVLCDHSAVCCLTLKVDVDGPKENLVTAHACDYDMCSDDWDPDTQEARLEVPITASKDQIRDGNKDLLLAFHSILSSGGGPYLAAFDGHRPPSVQVEAEDAETKSCSWTGDPHVHGMDNHGTFHLFKIGDYTMIENPNRDMEVQARTWPCRNGRATCICGVTIREKDDVIRISQCDQPYGGHHTSPTLQVASGLREGTVVKRSTDGQHFTVYLPSGMEVKIDAVTTSLNTYVTVPSVDAGQARGICGTFDGIANNEFTRRDGGRERQCNDCVPERFTESWKNPRQSSLFENLPPKTNETYVTKYCSCDKDADGQSRINCTAMGDIPRHTLKCSACAPVPDTHMPSFLNPAVGWSRRSALFMDVDEADPAFDVELYRDFRAAQVSWPTPGGISQQQAEVRCRQALQASQLWTSCGHSSDLLDRNVLDCVTDIQFGDSYDLVELSVAAFLTECQTQLTRDPANYVTDPRSGNSVLKPEFSTDVCSVFCLRHGTCVRGKCHCHQGFAGDNCHLIAGKGPQLARIRSNNTCDVNSRPCRKVFLDVTNIEDKASLACRVQVLQEDGSVSTQSHTEEAMFLSAGRLACHLPDTNGQAVTRLSLSATNDGHLYGNSLHVTVYDSTCLSCDQNGTCALLASTCNINNTCHQDGDVNPDDVTQVCNPSVSTSHWTTKPTQPSGNFPSIGAPSLSGPDDDFQMTCAVNTSATDASARFKVTWYIDDQPRQAATLAEGDLKCYLNLWDLPQSGQLSCKVRSFYAGQSEFSPLIASQPKLLTDIHP